MILKTVYGIIVLIIVGAVLLLVLALVSRYHRPQLSLRKDRLGPCPEKPNCVCSEYPGKDSFQSPLVVQNNPGKAWQNVKKIVVDMGGEILQDEGGYMHVVFRSRFFRFTDDLELRLDKENNVMHFRSASRVGYSDMGVNSKRIESLRSLYSGDT